MIPFSKLSPPGDQFVFKRELIADTDSCIPIYITKQQKNIIVDIIPVKFSIEANINKMILRMIFMFS